MPSSGCEDRCHKSPPCSREPKRICSLSTPSRPTAGRSSARRCSSESTARSAAHRRRRHLPERQGPDPPGGQVVIEQNDGWLVGRRYLSAHFLTAVLGGKKKKDSRARSATQHPLEHLEVMGQRALVDELVGADRDQSDRPGVNVEPNGYRHGLVYGRRPPYVALPYQLRQPTTYA